MVGEPVPTVCLIEDVCRILRFSRTTFDRLDAAKDLGLVELVPVGRIRRFTGDSVLAAARRTRWSKQTPAGGRP